MVDKRPQRRRTQAEKDAATQVSLDRAAEAMSDRAVEALIKPDIFSQRALKRMKLFKAAKGREPTSLKQLKKWEASPEGRAATAYDLDKRGKIIPD